nr:unnamed protein product [Spirometra erinaceieuropaei]
MRVITSERDFDSEFSKFLCLQELASFAIRPIRLTSIPLTDPSLVIAHWPHKSGDSAELQCVVDVSIPPFQVDLVYNPNGTLDFIVVVRKMTAFTLGQIGRKASVRLVWLNVPSNAGNADLFCFISRPGMKARHQKSLPNVTATLKISKPTRHHFDGGCPQAPVIKRLFTRPLSDETAPPQLGNRLSLICEAETGTENAPMQMAYADNETRFVICSGGEHDARDDVPTALEIPLACWFADWSKGGCFQRPDAMYSNHELANFTACKIKRRPHFHNAIRVIEFVIPLLQVKHFGGFVFCETVPWKFVGKGVQGERRLLSEALENYFDVEPQILSMEVSLLGWRCLVIACPPAEETTLETIVAHPQSLRRALAGTQFNILHESKSMKWRMSKEAAYFFPTPYLASINESNSSMPFITRLFRAPPNPAHVAEGGLATVECSVTQNYKDDHRTASERIHISYPRSSKAAHRPSGTTLIPSSGVVEPNSSWGIRCPLTSIFSSTAMHMYLLYKSELGPWNFIGIPLIRIKLQTDVDLGKRVRVESFRPVGLWMNKPLEDLTVTIFSPGGTNVVEITVKNAKIEHAGRNILVDPPPPDQISRKDVKFTIARGTQITCSVDGHPVPSVDMDIYPLRTAKLGIALDKGLGDLDSWMDLSQPNVDWPISSRKGEANVTVGHSRAPPDVVYVGVCQAESTINAQRFTVQRMFFFRVLVASKVTQKQKTFDLTLAALIICVLAFIVVSTLRELLILLKRSRSDGNRARQKVLDPTAEQVGSPTAVNPVGDQYVLAENADDNVLRNRSFQ